MIRFADTIRLALMLVCLVAILAPGNVWSRQINKDLPKVAEDIGVDPREGELIELEISFNDSANNFVQIGEIFRKNKPVILSFNYSDCPKMCSVQLENMILALRKIDFVAGEDFEVVSVSMDPLEQSSRARQTKEKYTRLYNKKGSEDGFHFLVGDKDAIKFLADECGVRFKYVPEQKLFSHPPVFVMLSPTGKIVRYIHGLDYDPDTIQLALVETAEGKIGSPINILSYGLGCYVFDASTGKYSFQAMFLMRLGGIITMFLLVVTLVPYWFFKKNAKNKNNSDKTIQVNPSTL